MFSVLAWQDVNQVRVTIRMKQLPKVLADLAVNNPEALKAIVAKVK